MCVTTKRASKIHEGKIQRIKSKNRKVGIIVGDLKTSFSVTD